MLHGGGMLLGLIYEYISRILLFMKHALKKVNFDIRPYDCFVFNQKFLQLGIWNNKHKQITSY